MCSHIFVLKCSCARFLNYSLLLEIGNFMQYLSATCSFYGKIAFKSCLDLGQNQGKLHNKAIVVSGGGGW